MPPGVPQPDNGLLNDGTGAVAQLFGTAYEFAMPTVTVTYKLPDEQHEYDAARLGSEALATLWEIDQRCRSLIKHGEPSEETERLAEEIREMIPGECLEL